MPVTDSFSIRLPQELYDRIIAVIAATGNEVTRTGLIVQALQHYFALLDLNPRLLEGYDRRQDKSVTKTGLLSHFDD